MVVSGAENSWVERERERENKKIIKKEYLNEVLKKNRNFDVRNIVK